MSYKVAQTRIIATLGATPTEHAAEGGERADSLTGHALVCPESRARATVWVEFVLGTVTANTQENHFATARRRRAEHRATAEALATIKRPASTVSSVRLVRVSWNLADDDGTISALKTVRDAVAIWLKVNDSPRDAIAWTYAAEQRRLLEDVRVRGRNLMVSRARGWVRVELYCPPGAASLPKGGA